MLCGVKAYSVHQPVLVHWCISLAKCMPLSTIYGHSHLAFDRHLPKIFAPPFFSFSMENVLSIHPRLGDDAKVTWDSPLLPFPSGSIRVDLPTKNRPVFPLDLGEQVDTRTPAGRPDALPGLSQRAGVLVILDHPFRRVGGY